MNGELRAHYLKALPRRVEALESSLAAAAADPAARATLRRIAHSLKGSGASYGFPRISAMAAAAEAAPEGELTDRIADLIDVVRTTISDAAAGAIDARHRDPSKG